MIRLRLSEIAAAVAALPPDDDVLIESIVTDSRQVRYGALFAALPGNRVDGHEFAATAVNLGAAALMLNRPLDLDVPQVVVGDVLRALGQVASVLRFRARPTVIGITGSNGKTTVKEMVASILRQQGEVLATEGNYNNELGVPLSLFGLEEKHRYAVLEFGASKMGDIAYLCGIAGPEIGLVTNVGPAHLQGFGDEEGVARAKGEIFAALPEDGCAVINGDQPWAEMWQEMNGASRTLTFGASEHNDVRLVSNGGKALIVTPGDRFELELSLPGEHNLINAAAAAAVAVALDVPLQQIRSGLEMVQPVPGRLNLIRAEEGWTVIDDTYNANPASLYSALRVLAGMQGTAWLVLGDMKELGTKSRKMHAEVGDAARALGVSRLFAVGDMSSSTVEAFGEGARHFQDRESLVDALCSALRPGINCLVKGSRSMGMETVVRAITCTRDIREAC